jgi:hypothetical protein
MKQVNHAQALIGGLKGSLNNVMHWTSINHYDDSILNRFTLNYLEYVSVQLKSQGPGISVLNWSDTD